MTSNKQALAAVALHLTLAGAFSPPPARRIASGGGSTADRGTAAPGRPSPPSALPVASSSAPPRSARTEDGDDGGGGGAPWWEDFRLADPDLAPSVLPDFPIFSTRFDADGKLDPSGPTRLVYLDSAATSHKPSAVTDALTRYYERENSNVHRGAHALSREATERYESARDKVASFVNAHSRNEIVFTSGATEAINLVAASLSRTCGKAPEDPRELYLREGDEVVITEAEHHSNIVPWQMAAERTGAALKYVPASASGEFDLDAFEELVGPNTKVVSVQHVSNVLGTVSPVDDIVRIVRSKAAPGAKILLDACQSVPHMPVDVQSLGVDLIAASGHKMCGPTGIGFLWGTESLLNSLAPYQGGGEMIDEVTMEKSTYAPSPARFEAGTPPIAQAVGLGAAIDYLDSLGMDRIHSYEAELASYLRRRLEDVKGVSVLGPPPGIERAALCAFVVEGVHPSDLGTFLDVRGVAIRAGHHCCQPLHRALGHSHSARASLYFYNTKEDVDVFVAELEDTLKFFRSLGGDGGEADGDTGEEDEAFVPLF
ncbi:hypothetical protein ACHAWF_018188 [Thalassiosira exigua]